MAFFDFTLTDADVGQALDPINGYLVSLSMLVPPVPEREAWDPLRRIFTRGFLTLRGNANLAPFALRNTISYNASSNPLAAGGDIWRNASVPYKGRLLLEAIPRGSVWQLRLSDVENVRAAHQDPTWWRDAIAARRKTAA